MICGYLSFEEYRDVSYLARRNGKCSWLECISEIQISSILIANQWLNAYQSIHLVKPRVSKKRSTLKHIGPFQACKHRIQVFLHQTLSNLKPTLRGTIPSHPKKALLKMMIFHFLRDMFPRSPGLGDLSPILQVSPESFDIKGTVWAQLDVVALPRPEDQQKVGKHMWAQGFNKKTSIYKYMYIMSSVYISFKFGDKM